MNSYKIMGSPRATEKAFSRDPLVVVVGTTNRQSASSLMKTAKR